MRIRWLLSYDEYNDIAIMGKEKKRKTKSKPI